MGAQFEVRRLDAALSDFLSLRNLRNLRIHSSVSNVATRLLIPLLFIDSKNEQPEDRRRGTCQGNEREDHERAVTQWRIKKRQPTQT